MPALLGAALFVLASACSKEPLKLTAQSPDVVTSDATVPDIPPNTPPQWPTDATLTATELSPGVVRLTWPHATDNSAIVQYKVHRDAVSIRSVPSSATSDLVEGPAVGTTSTFRIEAVDDQGAESTDGPQASFTPHDPVAPTWPAGSTLTATQITPSGLTLGWPMATDNVAVTGYRLDRDGQQLASLGADARNLVVDALSPWTDYTFAVVALDAAGNATNPLERAVQTPDDQAPTWPDGSILTTADASPTSATLSWPEATDDVAVVGYRVIRDLVIVTTTDTDTTAAILNDLSPQQSVTVRVEAVDAAGNVSTDGPEATLNTGDDSPPAWQANAQLAASQLTETGLSLGWTPATDNVAVTAYRVQQDGLELTATGGSTTWLAVTGLSPWQSYTFTVSAEDALGNTTVQTLTTTVKTPDTTPPLWPEGSTLAASDVTPNAVTLSWSAPSDNVGIETVNLYRDNVLLAALTAADAQFTDTGLSPWTSYSYRVEALDAALNLAADSPTLTVQTPDESAPQWPTNGTLSASKIEPTTLTLSWPQAVDDVSVVQYRVLQDDQELATVEGTVQTLDVTGLSPWTEYTFQVEAVDPADNWSTTGPALTVKTPDKSAPVWSDGGTLEVINLESTSLTLLWPQATDDVAIAGYTVSMDGAVLGTEAGDVTSVDIVDLSPWTDYSFQVTAADPAGNVTETALKTDIQTLDGGPPNWPAGAELSIGALGPKSVQLLWPEATDDVGVTAYRVYQDSALISAVTETQATIGGLTPETGYSFKVEAGDGAENWSSDGPSLSLTTSSDLWKNETVYDLLKPTCVGCHESGTAPYFASLEAFENGLAYNTQFVIGGDPEASELVKLLEGTSQGSYGQMPVGQDSFADLETIGQTLIGVADIKKWISLLGPPPAGEVAPPTGPLNERKRLEHIQSDLYEQLGLEVSDFYLIDVQWNDDVLCRKATSPLKSYPLIPADDHWVWCHHIVANVLTAEATTNALWISMGGPHWHSGITRSQSINQGFLLRLTQIAAEYCRLAFVKSDNATVLKHATLADTSATNAQAIRDNIAYLYLRFLGDVPTANRVDELFALFQTYESGVEEGTSGTDLVVAGWTAVCSTLIRSPLWLTH